MNAFKSYWLLFKWQLLRTRTVVPILIVVQMALALGIVYGLSYLMPSIDKVTALYLATGAPTMTLLVLGLNVVPQEVSRSKATGQDAYFSSLPVPRLARPAAEVSFWLLAQLPGTILAVFMGAWRYGFDLNIGGGLIPSVILVALTGASVGYAIAMLLRPELANQIASFIGIGLLLFSPINFPIERLPEALQAVHRVLPVKYMADLMRWAFTGDMAGGIGLAFAVVTAWCAAGIGLSWKVAKRKI